MRRRALMMGIALLAAAPAVAAGEPADPEPYVPTDMFTAPDGASMDLFGGYRGGVDAMGDVVVVAAMLDDEPAADAGAVYSFSRTPLGWNQQKLVSPSPEAGGEFGRSVALGASSPYAEQPDRLAVGAWREGGGNVHLYELRSNGQWRYHSTLAGCCEFGIDVAMSGGTLVVGTRYSDRADVFVENAGAWRKGASLTPPEPGGFEHFGTAVTAHAGETGGWIAVGDYALGAVYLFEGSGDTWTFRQRLDAPSTSHRFSASLDMNDTQLAVGAPRTGDPDQRGSAYMYENVAGTWAFDGELTPPDLPSASYFGADVDVGSWGPFVVVGAPQAEVGYPTGGPGEVFVYIASDSSWTLVDRVQAPDGRTGDGFGEGVDIDGARLVVGAPYRDDGRGVAYRFWDAPGDEAPSRRVLFVTSTPSPLPTQDQVLVDRLRANRYEVVLVDDDAPVPAGDADAILISSSVAPTKVGAKYRDVPIPLVTWEPYLFDDLGFTSGRQGDQGETSNSYTRLLEKTPMNFGYDTTSHVVTSAPMQLSYGRPQGQVRVYATVPGQQTRAVMFGYDSNAEMAGGFRAPEARFGLFFTYPSPRKLTGSSWVQQYWDDQLWYTDGGWGRFDAVFHCAVDHDNIVREWECFGEYGSGPPT